MPVSNITGSVSNVSLTAAGYTNPVTVDAGASVSASGANPYALTAGTSWTILNLGAVNGTPSGDGIQLNGGGKITNGANAMIYGGNVGIYMSAAPGNSIVNSGQIQGGASAVDLIGGFVSNATSGTITGGTDGIYVSGSSGTVVNAGSISATATGGGAGGVVLAAGGSVDNTGVIAGGYSGVDISGGAGTVINSGSISSIPSTGQDGVFLAADGYVNNTATGTITGQDDGVQIAGIAATVINSGSIYGNAYNGVGLNSGGTITNRSGGYIGAYNEAGVYMGGAGTIANASGATITGGQYGILVSNSYAVVLNAGSINGGFITGVYLAAGGYVSNAAGGTITGNYVGVAIGGGAGTVINAGYIEGTGTTASGNGGVVLSTGGYVYNGSGGTMTDESDGVAVSGGSGTVNNAGSISGFYYAGVALYSGGSVTNRSGGIIAGNLGVYFTSGGSVDNRVGAVIEGYHYGVLVSGGAGTVENAGTIDFYPNASASDAVYFAGSGSNLLIVDGGAVFDGVVIAVGSGNTIELTATYGAGTLSGMGTQYIGFQTVRVDSGAHWTLSGTFSGATAVYGTANGGTITSGGVETVHSSGEAIGAQVSSGGVLLSISGQLSDATVFSGGNAEQFVGSSTDTTLSGGHLLVFNGAVASGVNIESSGFVLASEFLGGTVGGTILDPVASSGGLVVAGAGAVVSGGTIQGGATLFQLAGVTSNVDLSGSQLVATTLFGPAQLAVASATTVESGGLLTINADGSTVDSTILNGGEILVSSGGVAEGVMVSSGGTMVTVYGDIGSTTVFAGGLVDQFVGSGTDTTLSGGHLLVLNGAVTSMVNVEAGGFVLAGEYAGGAVGGTIDDATVSSGGLVVLGTLSVLSGATIQSGGILFELAGQTSNVALAGLEYVGGGLPGVAPPNPPPPAVGTDTTVSSGGMQVVNSNGSAVDTNVLSGGEIVFNGGVVSGLSLSKGGVIDLLSFSFSSATSLTFVENAQNTGGTLTVSSGIDTMSINLLGQYVAGGFHESPDSGTGTLITYTGSAGSSIEIATAHH